MESASPFAWKRVLTTLLVIVACGVMVRLGLWQLDRLEQRRSFNARVQAQLDQPPLVLDSSSSQVENDLFNMEYRSVQVTGDYLHEQQIAIRNQAWENRIGVYLVTPLLIAGTDRAILVNRGWIPIEESSPEKWAKFDEPGSVVVEGVIRRSTTKAEIGRRDDPIQGLGEGPLLVWNLLNVARIDQQVTPDLLPVYVQQSPDPNWTSMPYRSEPPLDLSEGPHLGYAGQWFLFALILGIGYPIYLHKQVSGKKTLTPSMVRKK